MNTELFQALRRSRRAGLLLLLLSGALLIFHSPSVQADTQLDQRQQDEVPDDPNNSIFLPLVNAGAQDNNDDDDDSDYPDPQPAPTDLPGPGPVSNTTIALRPDATGATSGILVAGATSERAGMALYRFTEDDEGANASTCTGGCADAWPPLTVPSADALSAPQDLPLPLDTIEREDGTLQVTYGGWPLYFYAGDQSAADTNGDQVDGVWWLATVEASIEEELPSDVEVFSMRSSTASLGFAGEAGQMQISQASSTDWQSVDFEGSYTNPIVLMQPLSHNSRFPAMVRLRNITSSGFEFQVDEWEYQNGSHPVETVSYLVAESGTYQLGDLQIEAGTIEATHEWRRVDFAERFGDVPVVFSQMQTANDAQAAVVRQRQVYLGGFDVRTQEEEANDGQHGAETVGYLALSTGSGEIEGAPFEVVRTPDKVADRWFALNFAQRYEQPLLFADMQTFDGNNPALLRYQNLGESGAEIRVQEETSRDGETWHTTEVVGYLVLAADFGSNQPPSAQIDASATRGEAPFAVTFDADQSRDPDGEITSYQWDFGDGSTSSDAAPTHTYDTPGEYVVTLVVEDNAGDSAATSVTISVLEAAPEPTPEPTTGPTTGPTTEPTTGPTAQPTPQPSGTPAPTAVPTETPDPNVTGERWSNPATWGGSVPGANAAVTIPEGKRVLLDVSPPALKSLMVHGELIVEDRDVELTTGWMMVHGLFEMGTPDDPFTSNATITINGPASDDIMKMGARVWGVMNGTLRIHAATPTSWLKLNETASVGDTEIVLTKNPGWRAGDRIVIASTDFDYEQDEVVTITAVNGNRLTLDRPLEYMHWGALQTYGGTEIDQRAEVGLLTRSVTVQGPESAGGESGLGAHLMVMGESHLHLHGVEMQRMGQSGKQGRYPVHFHLAGDGVRGSRVENSTIHSSFSRCITIHGSNGITVKNVVAHDTFGHCFFLEDGFEQDNVFEGNLGLGTHRPEGNNALLDSDKRDVSTYWITHPNNTFINNVAAGSRGRGFWIALPEHPTGPSQSAENNANVWNRREQFAPFRGNVAHSNGNDGLHLDRGPDGSPEGFTEVTSHEALSNPLDEDSEPVWSVFEDFVAYKNRNRAVWLRGGHHVLEGAILSDNAIGATFASHETVARNSIFVGETANVGNTEPWMSDEQKGEGGRSLPRFYQPDFQIRGFEYYDGNVGVEDSYFEAYTPNAQRQASALGILDFTGFPMSPRNWSSGLTFAQGTQPIYAQTRSAPENPRNGSEDGYRSTVIEDRDGTLSGTANRFVTVDNGILHTDRCVKREAWNVWVCNEEYAALGVQTDGNQLASVNVSRNGTTHKLFGNGSAPSDRFYTILLPDVAHELTFDERIPQRFRLVIQDSAGKTLYVQIPGYTQYPRVEKYGREIAPAYSLAALGEMTDSSFYYDTANATLHVRIVADADDYYEALEIIQNGTPPPVTGSGSGLTGAYFDNIDFEGTPQTRVDPTINFSWQEGEAPLPNFPEDRFSVRWTGEVQATEAGRYTFTMRADDAIRLTVCGEVLIDQDRYTSDDLNGAITLDANQRCPVEIELIEYTYGARAQLWWSYNGYPRHVVPQAQLYP